MQSLCGSMNPKWILVTGASSDIGLETIKLLLKKNELVWGIYKSNFSKLESLKKKYPNNLFYRNMTSFNLMN